MKKGKKAYKAKKLTIKRAKLKSGYNPQTGRLTGRAKPAQKRLDKRAEQLMTRDGLSAPEAKAIARAEMRGNPKMDWRRGGK